MTRQGRRLSLKMTGKDVRRLQEGLRRLGYAIPSPEMDVSLFGPATRRAVVALQKKHGLPATGVVDDETAARIEASVKAPRAGARRFVVKGQVRDEDGGPVAGITVTASDKDLRSERPLGEAVTDRQGRYAIRYGAGQFSRGEKGTADLIVRAHSRQGVLLGSSGVLFNAGRSERVNLTIRRQAESGVSEYEQLLARLRPFLRGVQPADLTDDDLAFLLGKTGMDRPRLELLRRAARLSRDTAVPTEVFYGLGRRELPLQLEGVLAQKGEVLAEALEAAARDRLIPATVTEAFARVRSRLEHLALERGVLTVRRVTGRLIDETARTPLAGFTVRALDLDAGPAHRDLGCAVTDHRGLFGLAHTLLRTRLPEEASRRLQLRITTDEGKVIEDNLIVTIETDRDAVVEVPVRIPPRLAVPSPSIERVAAQLGQPLSPGLGAFLEAHGLRSLADVRSKTKGGIRRFLGFLKRQGVTVPVFSDAEQELIRHLDAHAELDRLAPGEVERNARLLRLGFDGPLAIAGATRARFVRMAHREMRGDFKAGQMHRELEMERRVLYNIGAGMAAVLANVYPEQRPGWEAILGGDGFDPGELASVRCECRDCEAAVSPLAYLADLLTYTLAHVQRRPDGDPIALHDLAETFHQPFGDLPATCEAAEEQVRQVRLCIEGLRAYLRAHPPSPAKQVTLDEAEREYRQAAYDALVARLGAAAEEIRRARGAGRGVREALGARLGIDLGVEQPDHLDALHLSANAGEPRPITEAALETLFGLADTTRDRLSKGAKRGDPAPAQLTRWNLDGIEWNRNTDADGTVYLSLTNPAAANYVVEVYRDRDRTQRVGVGSRSTAEGVIALGPDNGSWLSGTVAIRYRQDSHAIEISAIPELLAWRLQHLRTLWREQDWPSDRYVDTPSGPFTDAELLPVIDPDVIGPDDFRVPVPRANPIFDIWVRRRRWVDEQLERLLADPEHPNLNLRSPATHDGHPVMDAAGTAVTVPNFDALFDRMGAPVRYEAFRPQINAFQEISVTAWPAGTTRRDLEALRTRLVEGVEVDATTERIRTDFALTVDSFARLMAILDKHQAWAGDDREPFVSAEEDLEVRSILVQAWKSRLFTEWRAEERDHALVFGPHEFWISLRERQAGDWPPTRSGPLVDPDEVKLADLPEPTAGVRAREVWQRRQTELASLPAELRAGHADGGLEAMLQLALPALPAGETQTDRLTALRNRLEDPAEVENARREVTDALHFASVDAFTRLMVIVEKARRGDASRPTAEEWGEAYAILARPRKITHVYPEWLREETGLPYWEWLKARLPAWRATAEDRRGWQEGLRVRSRPPLIDPDLIGPDFLRDPVAGAAARLFQEREAWLTERAAALMPSPPAPYAVDDLDGLVATTLFRGEERAAIKASLQAIRESPGPDGGLSGVLRRALGAPPPDLDALRADLADPQRETQAVRAIAETLYLTRQEFERLMDIRDLESAGGAVADPEWDDVYTVGTRVTLVARVMSLLDGKTFVDTLPARLGQLDISMEALRHLARIRDLLAGGEEARDSEWSDVASILVQVEKRRLFAEWRRQEAAERLIHGPDHFRLPSPPALEFPPPRPEPLPAWRATWSGLRAWQDTLQSRADQERATLDALQAAVSATEEATLPMLRDALILASPAEGDTVERKGKWLTDRLLIDTRTDGCQLTTRVAQAIEILQGLLWSLRTGQLADTHPELMLDADHFEEEWKWIGSYATWRAAMFVFLYPENILLPGLRSTQTPAFEALVQTLRSPRPLTPDRACEEAQRYADYFNDICSLEPAATCWALTRVHSGNCRDRAERSERYRFYVFARGGITKRVYWSAYDPADGVQTYWREVEGLGGMEIIGAQPYDVSETRRFVYLFAAGPHTLGFKKYDLEAESWDAELTPLDLPDGTASFSAVLNQRLDTWRPRLAIRVDQSDKTDQREVFTRRLNAEGDNWEDEEFRQFRRRVTMGAFDAAGDLHMVSVAQEDTELLQEVGSLCALHQVADYYLLLCGRSQAGQLFVARYRYTSCLIDAEREEKEWAWYRDAGDWLELGETQVGPKDWIGSFRWKDSNLFYVFWRNGPFSYYQMVEATEDQLRTVSDPEVSLAGLEGLARESGPPHEIVGDTPARVVAYRTGNGAVWRGSFHRDAEQRLSPLPATRIAPQALGPLAITERLSDAERQARRLETEVVFAINAKGSPSNRTCLEEAYYFVPVHLALQLQARGEYIAALDWFRTVYDYGAPREQRKIYWGLVEEELGAVVFERAEDWLRDPLNPHAIASTRVNSYTTFTLLSLVRCLLDYADAEFTRDTAESVARARTLYLTALELLDTEPLAPPHDACGDVIGSLEIEVPDARWRAAAEDLREHLRDIRDYEALKGAVREIAEILRRNDAWARRFRDAERVLERQHVDQDGSPTLEVVLRRRDQRLADTRAILGAQAGPARAFVRAREVAGQDYLHAVAYVSGIDPATLERDQIELPWLRQPRGAGAVENDPGPQPGGLAGDGWLDVLDPSRRVLLDWLAEREPVPVLEHYQHMANEHVPSLLFDFCIPRNPVLEALRLRADLNLYKLRTCRNIAGMKRHLEPYAAPTDTVSGLPQMGGGQLLLPGTVRLPPTPYRSSVLIERAKHVVQMAAQAETAMLSAFEKRDEAEFNLLKARQDVRLARAGIQLQDLRLKEAEDGRKLAELQKERAQIQKDTYEEWIQAELNQWELSMIAGFQEAQAAQISAAEWDAGAQAFQALTTAATASFGAGAAAASAAAVGVFAYERYRHLAEAIRAETKAQVASVWASYERRKQEWELQKTLAEQDLAIGDQQITLADDHVRIVGQERRIAEMQAEHAEATVDFLSTRFTNVELYDWMGRVLADVYSYFLSQATAVAQQAASAVAFERAEVPPPFIQADYWEAPSEDVVGSRADGRPPDRRGLTGSARLLQDIVRLEQYALDTNQRKLHLSKTVSLARMAPAEFQRFRETGVLPFATGLDLFDRDFPGHYLRLIHKVRTSVVALVPPTHGIRATLSTTGVSRVVTGPDVFQTVVLRRDPESVALSSPREATGLFELDPQPDMRLPFEGHGVDTTWEFRMPKAANQFDYGTIADVLITIEYTALNSFAYGQQVIQDLNAGPAFSADRPFSFRHEFADQWYDLHNPEQIAAPMVVRFQTVRADFPPNLDDLAVQHVLLALGGSAGRAGKVPVIQLRFTPQGEQGALGGQATPSEGLVSTRSGSASSWMALIGKSPIGTWQLALPDTPEVRSLFGNEAMDDILFVITYSGRLPEWPV